MMTKRKKRPRGLEGRRARAGVLFILPWLIGFFGMFVRSLVTSLVYSVSKTTIADFGMNTEYIGFDYYYRALFIDSNFVRSLIEEVGGMLPQVVIILAFSLMMAVILSGSFKGRTFFRSVFFLPVICGSGLILSIMNGDVLSASIMSGARSSMLFQTSGIDKILLEMGMNTELVATLMGIVNGVFDLSWQSGLQILLFISGIMGISPALYEAAKIEGATAWESFWKITFPCFHPLWCSTPYIPSLIASSTTTTAFCSISSVLPRSWISAIPAPWPGCTSWWSACWWAWFTSSSTNGSSIRWSEASA